MRLLPRPAHAAHPLHSRRGGLLRVRVPQPAAVHEVHAAAGVCWKGARASWRAGSCACVLCCGGTALRRCEYPSGRLLNGGACSCESTQPRCVWFLHPTNRSCWCAPPPCPRVSQVPVVPAELSLWDEYWGGRLPLNALTDGLRGLRESGAQVTSRAGDVLALGDERVSEGRLQSAQASFKSCLFFPWHRAVCLTAVGRVVEVQPDRSS